MCIRDSTCVDYAVVKKNVLEKHVIFLKLLHFDGSKLCNDIWLIKGNVEFKGVERTYSMYNLIRKTQKM